jgi:hypothetical protein
MFFAFEKIFSSFIFLYYIIYQFCATAIYHANLSMKNVSKEKYILSQLQCIVFSVCGFSFTFNHTTRWSLKHFWWVINFFLLIFTPNGTNNTVIIWWRSSLYYILFLSNLYTPVMMSYLKIYLCLYILKEIQTQYFFLWKKRFYPWMQCNSMDAMYE